MGTHAPYAINLDARYAPLEVVDVQALVEGFTVPKGVMHRPRAPERTVILMIEGAGVIPTGDK